MTTSYLSRHRPICSVLQELQKRLTVSGDPHCLALCDEALDYARRMSARLMEYKRREEANASHDAAANQ